MEDALQRIDRRIADLDAFDAGQISEGTDSSVLALQEKLNTLMLNIFGSGTAEYERHQLTMTNLDTTTYNVWSNTPSDEIQAGVERGIANARAILQAIREGFQEEIEDSSAASDSKLLRAYEGLDLHPTIARHVSQLFHDGHYANAIEDSVKALNGLVRLNSGVDDKDGTTLMEFVFNPSNPILKFNALADQSDRDEQKGFMLMFSGAVTGLRNPRAHRLIRDDPESALEFIAFVSLLAKLADKAKK